MRRGFNNRRTWISLLVLIAVAGGIIGGVMLIERSQQRAQEAELAEEAQRLQSSLFTDENTIQIGDQVLGFDHRIETFLFIGTDYSGGQDIPGSTLKRQPMADFLMLMVLDHTRNRIGMLQLDRNTITRISYLDGNGESVGERYLQLCIAHWCGGTPEMAAENTVKAVKYYLGDLDEIDGYFVINMKDIALLNNAVGGVTITVDEDLTGLDPALKKGAEVALTDEQAAAYLQARMSVGQGTNEERMSRQRNYMTGMFSKVRERASADAKFALDLFERLKKAAFTNMTGNDFSRIAQKLMKGENAGIRTIEGETIAGYRANADEPHAEFYPNEASLREQLTDLFSLVPVEIPDITELGIVSEEDAEEASVGEDEDEEEEEDEEDLTPDDGEPPVDEFEDEEDEDEEEDEEPGEEPGGEPKEGTDGKPGEGTAEGTAEKPAEAQGEDTDAKPRQETTSEGQE